MKSTGMAPETAAAQPHRPEVVFVSRYFYPFTGGLEKRVAALADALAERGMAVTILTSRLCAGYAHRQERSGVVIYRFACPRIKGLGACVFISRAVLFLILQRTRYQAVHAFQVGHSSAAAIIIGRLLGKRAFLHLSGGGRGGDVGRHRQSPWGRLFLRLSRCASAIVVLTPGMQHEVSRIAYPAGRTVCIPNGVDTDTYRPAQGREQLRHALNLPPAPLILYTGRLSPEKGLAVLLKAHAQLSTSAPVLAIIGSGPEHARLERLAAELGTAGRVMLRQAQTDIVPWYQCADIFVMASFHEGMSNSVLEAMACGLPVVATAVSGNSDLVTHGRSGLLVQPDDAAALAAALESLLSDPGKARELGAYGRHIAETKYRFDTMIDRFCALYRRRDI